MQIRRHVAVFAALLAGLTLASSASAATIIVTTAEDEAFLNDGHVSLREAITAINAGNNLGDPDIKNQLPPPGTFGINDTIDFNIPGSGPHRILVGAGSVLGALPALTKPVLIDGTSQPGSEPNKLVNADNAATQILLDGSGAGLNTLGLVLAAGSSESTIKGLDVFGFDGGGIAIQSN
ncbi:MAG TPA: CSLREA domain-containing protein, partial [Solirubrobacteraceae bacterium]|nr:CSLREA domain-containing protein [Solirubrobacteraceae bacterium]